MNVEIKNKIKDVLNEFEHWHVIDIDMNNKTVNLNLLNRNPNFVQFYIKLISDLFTDYSVHVSSGFSLDIVDNAIKYLKANYSEDDIGEYELQALPLLRGEHPFGNEWVNIEVGA